MLFRVRQVRRRASSDTPSGTARTAGTGPGKNTSSLPFRQPVFNGAGYRFALAFVPIIEGLLTTKRS